MSYFGWKPYVSVAERRAQAEKKMKAMAKKGHPVSPIRIEGRTIARTFWGKAWCENLESYSDYENRLPRGRTYVRNGSVVDLQIQPGKIEAHVSGSEMYRVTIAIKPLPKEKWKALCQDCAGAIDSLVELLQGRFSKGVMERVCQHGKGLFPAPSEISLSCSCPDWATMCKHVAAVLYGVGARLDEKPELLFVLRGVDEKELLSRSASQLGTANIDAADKDKVLAGDDLADLFGLEMAEAEPQKKPALAKAAPAKKTTTGKAGRPPKTGAAPKTSAASKASAAKKATPAVEKKAPATKKGRTTTAKAPEVPAPSVTSPESPKPKRGRPRKEAAQTAQPTKTANVKAASKKTTAQKKSGMI